MGSLPHHRVAALLAALLGLASCPAVADADPAPDGTSRSTGWSAGTLPSSGVVPDGELRPLFGAAAGPPIWKSNNPEILRGATGWLMQNARPDPGRGGHALPLTGAAAVYLFHINKSGAPRTLHLLMSNAGQGPMAASYRGSLYTNAERPLHGEGSGPGYAVAQDWLAGSLRTPTTSVQVSPRRVVELARASLPDGAMVDGRFELDGLRSANLYTVATTSGRLEDAINASQTGPVDGEIHAPGAAAYGREAGVYAGSRHLASELLTVPPAPAYLGYALNTTSRFNPSLPDCTAPALMALGDSAPRTWGNYGHLCEVKLRLVSDGQPRRVRLSLVSSALGASTSFTFNGPVRVGDRTIPVYTTAQKPSCELCTLEVPPRGIEVPLRLYIPGLITVGQQLVLESL